MSELNLTMLLQGRRPEDQLGCHVGFEGLVAAGALADYRAVPYRGAETTDDWAQLFHSVLKHMRTSGSNALLLQYFHGCDLPDPRPLIERVRALPQRPIVATSCGDPFGPFRNAPPASLSRAASRSDVTFTTSMGRLATRLERTGAKRITLLPLSACDVRFGSTPAPSPEGDREFDVVFIGSRPGGRNFTKHLYWSGRRRLRYVELLERRYGQRFALFGHGWSGHTSWQGPVDFAEQAATSQRARVVFGGFPASLCDYYASNRPFIQMLSGTVMVDLKVPRVDRLLKDNDEWLLYVDEQDAISKIDAVLDGRIDGGKVGASGAAAVRNRHMDSHRARLMVTILDEIGEAQRANRPAVCPPLDFFHAGVDGRAEAASALRRW